jgi:hypothetical protein
VCNPAALFAIQGGLAVTSQAINFIQQKQAADAQEEFNERLIQETEKAATRDALRNYESVQSRRSEQRTSAATEIDRVTRQAIQATGTATAGAAKSGVAGQSLAALILDFGRKEGEFRTSVGRRLRFQEAQAERDLEAIHSQGRGRVIAAAQPPVQHPSYVGAALRAGTAIVGAYQDNTVIGPDGNRSFA